MITRCLRCHGLLVIRQTMSTRVERKNAGNEETVFEGKYGGYKRIL